MGERYTSIRRLEGDSPGDRRSLPSTPDLLFMVGLSLAIFAGLGLGFVLG